MPRITVILPVRDGLGTLPRAIESIRAQTFRDWELVVINDGSTDGSGQWLDSVASHDPRIRIHHCSHRGIAGALNEGLRVARGPCIARMDADDECHPERFADQIARFESEPDLGVVGCGVAFGGDPRAAGGYARHVDWLNTLLTPERIALARFIESPFAHPSVLFRRACVERHGAYRDGPFPEDYELWLRWFEAGGCLIAGYIDIDPAKIGRRLENRPVIGPLDIPPPGKAFIIGYVTIPGARDLQRTFLDERGYREGRDFLFAA